MTKEGKTQFFETASGNVEFTERFIPQFGVFLSLVYTVQFQLVGSSFSNKMQCAVISE